MNKIGTSGIDLYGYDENGSVHFFAGSYNFKSTITFQFSEHNKSVIFTYLLILPSYDVIKPSSFKIGYDKSSYFQIFPSEIELPVTFYGTSITQGRAFLMSIGCQESCSFQFAISDSWDKEFFKEKLLN